MAAGTSDATDREILVSRVIEAPRPEVFEAFTTAEHLAGWCTPKGGDITTHAFEFAPGGVWDATIHGPDGSAYPTHWTWQEIAAPERITWLYRAGRDDPQGVPTTLTLEDRGEETEVTLRIRFTSKEDRDQRVAKYGAVQGARHTLDQLATYVKGRDS
jgi:uncharacterized protein YndB with AHSA1/START domain